MMDWTAGMLIASAMLTASAQTPDVIRPGAVWLDDRGQEIQAHGGGIVKVGKEYFWFGEDRSPGQEAGTRAVTCYSSTDLARWRWRGRVLSLSDPEHLGQGTVLERPKVYWNAKTRKYVLYFHLDDAHYRLARVGVAVSDTVDGTYTYVRSFRPLDQESRDIGQFVDDDGSAYLIFESRPTHGFYIAKLSEDYLSVEKETSFIKAPLEGGAIVHYQSLYYVLGSHMTGWRANPNVYAISPSLSGPWTEFRDIAPPETNTYQSQSSMLLKVVGTKATTVIYMGDRWKPQDLGDSRYVWMPVTTGGGTMQLPEPQPWTIDVKRGVAKVLAEDSQQ